MPVAVLGTGNMVMAPLVVMRPIWPAVFSVNHRLPSGPAVIPKGPLLAVGMGNSVMVPLVVMRPIWPMFWSVNHRWPSGPAVIPTGPLFCVLLPCPELTLNSVMVPLVVMRPIWPVSPSVNQRLPSGPDVMKKGVLGTGNVVTVPAAQAGATLRLTRPTQLHRAMSRAARRGRTRERFMLLPLFLSSHAGRMG